jgi:hypothetical protein
VVECLPSKHEAFSSNPSAAGEGGVESSCWGHGWLMSVILATQEAEIRRIVVQSRWGK